MYWLIKKEVKTISRGYNIYIYAQNNDLSSFNYVVERNIIYFSLAVI